MGKFREPFDAGSVFNYVRYGIIDKPSSRFLRRPVLTQQYRTFFLLSVVDPTNTVRMTV